jgi:hypothetical protein
MQHTTEAPKQYQCRHIFTDGRRCASPCLRQQEFCYYHHTTRKPVANPKQRRSRRSTFHLPLPEDRSAIQSSIGEVLQRIASNDIDPRRAGLLLYGLQIASLNLPKQQNTQRHARPELIETVEEITIDPALGVLAPRAEISETPQRKSTIGLLLESMMRREKVEEEAVNPGINEVAAAIPAIVPILQATEDDPDIACSPQPNPTKKTSTQPQKMSFRPKAAHLPPQWRNLLLPCRCLLSSTPPKQKNCHFDRRRRTCRRSGEICCLPLPLPALLNATQTKKLSFRPEAAHLPPQRRNPLFAFAVACSPQHHPIPKNVNATSKDVISTEGGALAAAAEKSAVALPLPALLNATQTKKLSFRPKAAHLPPQWRNPLFAFAVVCSPQHHPNKKTVISTEGGALAAAVEKSAVCLCRCLFSSTPPKQKNCHFNRKRTHSATLPARDFSKHSHSLNLPQKLPVFSRRITK